INESLAVAPSRLVKMAAQPPRIKMLALRGSRLIVPKVRRIGATTTNDTTDRHCALSQPHRRARRDSLPPRHATAITFRPAIARCQADPNTCPERTAHNGVYVTVIGLPRSVIGLPRSENPIRAHKRGE